jgi:hypothetical protein
MSFSPSLSPPRSLSPSACSAFKECPLAFRFSYIERLPEPPSAAASKGTLVHRALELLLDRPPDERVIDAALADLGRARAELATDPEFSELALTDEQWAAFAADAETLVHRYFELEDPRTVRPRGGGRKQVGGPRGGGGPGGLEPRQGDQHGGLGGHRDNNRAGAWGRGGGGRRGGGDQ